MEQSNGKLLYIEPTSLNDPKNDNVGFEMEDLCIAVDLQVRVPDRYSCGINGYEVTAENPSRTISFLQGKNGVLTTSFTDISSKNSIGEGDNETLGITNISISYTTRFFPEVTITFTDVKGSSLMQPMEEEFINSKKDNVNLTQGSFFRALFSFPYPMFILKVKGHYGKCVTYHLSVLDFDSRFSSNNGNFDVTVQFIGYMYGVYADLPLRYLLVAPYLDFNENNKHWGNNSINGGKYTFSDGTPMPTFLELSQRINGIIRGNRQILQNDTTVSLYRSNKARISFFKGLLQNYETLINSFKSKSYEISDEVFLITEKQEIDGVEEAIHSRVHMKELGVGITRYNSDRAHRKIVNDLSEYYDSSGLEVNLKKWEIEPILVKNESGEWVCTKDNIQISAHIINKLSANERDEITGHIFYGAGFVEECCNRLSHYESENEEIEVEVKEKIKQYTREIIGFDPTVSNIVKLTFAHLDSFMNAFYGCTEKVANIQRTFKDLAINVENTDINPHKQIAFVPPFPLMVSSRKETVYPGEVPGITRENMPELELTESILSVAEGTLRNYSVQTREYTYIPNTICDLLNHTNPYGMLSEPSHSIEESVLLSFLNRFYTQFSIHCNFIQHGNIINGAYSGYSLNNSVTSFAKNEAYNIFYALNNSKNLSDYIGGIDINAETNEYIKALEGKNSTKLKNMPGYIPRALIDENNKYTWLSKHHNINVLYYQNFPHLKMLLDDNNNKNYSTYIYPLDMSLYETQDSWDSIFKIYSNNDVIKKSQEKINEHKDSKKIDILNAFENYTENLNIDIIKKYFSNTLESFSSNEGVTLYKILDDYENGINNDIKLTKTNFYKFEKNIKLSTELRAQKFLDTLPFNMEYINKNGISPKGLYKLPRIVLVKMGADILTNNGDASKQCYLNYKWPVKKTLINIFREWVKKDFKKIENELSFVSRMNHDITFSGIKKYLKYKQGSIEEFFKIAFRRTQSGSLYNGFVISETEISDEALEKKYGFYKLSSENDERLQQIINNLTNRTGNETELWDEIFHLLFFISVNNSIKESSISYREKNGDVEWDFEYKTDKKNILFGIITEMKYTFATGELIVNKDTFTKYFKVTFENGEFVILNVTKDEVGTNTTYNGVEIKQLFGQNGTGNNRNYYDKDEILQEILCYYDGSTNTLPEEFYIESTYNFKMTVNEINKIDTAYTKSAINVLFTTLKNLYKKLNEQQQASNVEDSTLNTTADMKASVYLRLKSLYDKWLCSLSYDFWKLDKKNGEFNRFKFLDTYYTDISQKLYIDINTLNEVLDSIIVGADTSNISVYEFLDSLSHTSKCSLIASPALHVFDTTDGGKSYAEIFKPQSFNKMTNEEDSGPGYLWIYSHTPSSHLNMAESDFACDSFDLADSQGNINPTLPEDLFGEDSVIPAFGVTIGTAKQNMFESVDINMKSMKETEFSIRNQLMIADSAGKNPQVANFVSQNLYHVYSNYSYTVEVSGMGNATISPMMYFQLNNIPMFKGAYYIIDVNHNITADGMKTNFTGVRINKNKLPIVSDNIIMSSFEDLTAGYAPETNLTVSKEVPWSGKYCTKDLYESFYVSGGNDEETLKNTCEKMGIAVTYTKRGLLNGNFTFTARTISNNENVSHIVFDMICISQYFNRGYCNAVTLLYESNTGEYSVEVSPQWNILKEISLRIDGKKIKNGCGFNAIPEPFLYTLSYIYTFKNGEQVKSADKILRRITGGKVSEQTKKTIADMYLNKIERQGT